MIDLSALELLQKGVPLDVLGGSRMENLLHDVLDHLIFLLDVPLLALQLGSELLVFKYHLIQLLLK